MLNDDTMCRRKQVITEMVNTSFELEKKIGFQEFVNANEA
jgi:hypothetical protein